MALVSVVIFLALLMPAQNPAVQGGRSIKAHALKKL
jgi:hypothetical protein